MNSQSRNYQRRYESLKIKAETLSSLRKLVALPPEHDITKRQWSILESQLSAAEARLQSKLKRATKQYLPQVDDPQIARGLNAIYGEIGMVSDDEVFRVIGLNGRKIIEANIYDLKEAWQKPLRF